MLTNKSKISALPHIPHNYYYVSCVTQNIMVSDQYCLSDQIYCNAPVSARPDFFSLMSGLTDHFPPGQVSYFSV